HRPVHRAGRGELRLSQPLLLQPDAQTTPRRFPRGLPQGPTLLMDSFVQGSPLHGLCLLVSLLASLGLGILARHFGKQEPCLARIRHFLIFGSIASWLMTQIAPWIQGQFSWSESLPLHFCNLANLLGAYALATR